MERKGYKRFTENIQNREPNLKFDVWHVAKSITKTLTKKAKNKECSVLFPGIKAISNHL
ncbi:unnamed protein product [Porites lobata]|uniref:Transposase IS204/IS1001/IS1096/IS1165 DDE domain-containing protein n=1 Tax=Porites lobata TaxID=104759 RepID=A0ABN8QFL1_9CNID|nr:unnamed protein product [Porites lobata]